MPFTPPYDGAYGMPLMAQRKRSSLALIGQALIQNLQQEAPYERAMSRFSPDDDTTYPPEGSPLDSAQSRRAMPVVVH
jgi:hypothetical protein